MTTLDVRDYGAAGDGSTDDTKAIQQAINKASSGDSIYLPNGTYLIQQTDASIDTILSLDGSTHADNLTIYGDGSETELLLGDASDGYNMFEIKAPNDWSLNINNMTVNADRAGNLDYELFNGVNLALLRDDTASGTGDILLEDIEWKNSGGQGVNIGYGGVTLRNCTVSNCMRHGIVFNLHRSGLNGPKARVEKSHVIACGSNDNDGVGTGNGINCHGGEGVVEDTVIEQCDYSGATKTSTDASDFIYRRVRMDNNNGDKIYETTATPDSATVTFEDIVIENCSSYCRIASGEHYVASGSDFVAHSNDVGGEAGLLSFVSNGTEQDAYWQGDGTHWINNTTNGAGINAWSPMSGSYADVYYHENNDDGAFDSTKNFSVNIQAVNTKQDINSVPTAYEVGAWSDGSTTDTVDEGESDHTSFESWTPQWESTHSDYSVVETGSNQGDALLSLEPESPGRHFLSWDEVGKPKDAEVFVLNKAVSDDDIYDSWCRPIVRGSGSAGSESGYLTDVKPEALRIRKYVNGELTTLAETSTSSNLSKWFYLRFRVDGNQLKVRQWDYGDSEPTAWDIEVTDDQISSSGLAGIGGVSADTQYWDYVSIATDGGTARVGETDSVPSVAYIKPTGDEAIQGTVPIQISASTTEYSDDELTVEYRLDDEQWSLAEYNPDTGYHGDTMDTTGVSSGDHTLSARATDPGDGTASTSISVQIETDTSPTIDSFSVSEVGSDVQLAEFEANWRVSDSESDLRSVELVLTRESDGAVVDDESVDVISSEASDTTRLVAEKDAGSKVYYTLDLVVTDQSGNTASETVSATSSKSGDPPVINRLSVSEAGYSDTDAEVSVLWDVSDPDNGLESVQIGVTDSNGTNQGVTWSLNGSRASDIDTFEIKGGGDETFDVTVSVTNTIGESSEEATSVSG